VLHLSIRLLDGECAINRFEIHFSFQHSGLHGPGDDEAIVLLITEHQLDFPDGLSEYNSKSVLKVK